MRIAVIGAGGLGGTFGARLARGGEEVHFVARGRHLEAMRSGGLQVESILGDFALAPDEIHATDDPGRIGPVDIVLFTVKSYDTDEAAAALAPLVGPQTAVISLQNGIDNEERIAAVIGADHVVGGVAWIFAGIVAPGVIRHTGGPARIAFGELSGRRSERLEAFLAACRGAQIPAEIPDDIRVTLWTKYAFICAQAGVTAATRQPIGVIRDTPQTWALFRAVIEEVAGVGRAEGVPLADGIVEAQLAAAAALDPALRSSLHDDLVGGRRVELDALLGELIRRAGRFDLDVPTSAFLYAILLPQSSARG
jgi:2-dehydropantoate 2-reductase